MGSLSRVNLCAPTQVGARKRAGSAVAGLAVTRVPAQTAPARFPLAVTGGSTKILY